MFLLKTGQEKETTCSIRQSPSNKDVCAPCGFVAHHHDLQTTLHGETESRTGLKFGSDYSEVTLLMVWKGA